MVHQIADLLHAVDLCREALARPGVAAEDRGGGMPVASGDAATGRQQSRATQPARGDFGARGQDSVRRIAHRLDGGDPVVEEQSELSGKLVVLEGAHRVRIGDRVHVVEVDVRVDQARHDPSPGRIHLPSAPEWFGRDGSDLSAVDGDVVQTGQRLTAVEDMRATDHEVIGRRATSLGARSFFGFLGHRSHSC
ncbi:hypothetical protein ACWCPX_18200 [Streptomyces olivaceoviridis]